MRQHSTPPVSCDPLLDFFRDSDGEKKTLSQEDDPMVHEHGCTRVLPIAQPCCSPDSAGNRPRSPECRPVSKLWTGAPSSSQPAQPQEVVFGLGVQLDVSTADIFDLVNRFDIDAVPQVSNNGPGTGDVSDMDDLAIRDATGWDNFDDYATEAAAEKMGSQDRGGA